MAYRCSGCGSVVVEDQTICPFCGTDNAVPNINEKGASIRYCPHCGNAVSDNDKFCRSCGQSVVEVRNTADTRQAQQYYEQSPVQPQKHHTLRTILMVIGAIAVLGWLFNLFTEPAVDYDLEYKNGGLYYSNRDYEKAQECFLKLDEDYKDTKMYLTLCQGHLYQFLTDEQVNELKHNLDFNDAKTLLLSRSSIAESFLMGYWTNDKKTKSFELYDEGDKRHVQTNLASSSSWDKAEGFYIIDGVFGLWMPKKEDKSDDKQEIAESEIIERSDEYDRKDLFRISMLDEDKIAVVILKDDSRYTLTRD